MQTIKWNDKLGARRRAAWMLLVVDDEIVHYFSQTEQPHNIDGVIAVVGREFEKNGRWSNNTWTLAVADNVRVIKGHYGFETGSFLEGLARSCKSEPIYTWEDLAAAMQLSMDDCKRFGRDTLPKTAARLDEVARAMGGL